MTRLEVNSSVDSVSKTVSTERIGHQQRIKSNTKPQAEIIRRHVRQVKRRRTDSEMVAIAALDPLWRRRAPPLTPVFESFI